MTITVEQVIDALVTDLHWTIHGAHEACNLLRGSAYLQPFSHPGRQPLHVFVAFEGGFTSGVRLTLVIPARRLECCSFATRG